MYCRLTVRYKLYENVPEWNQFPTLNSEIGENGFNVKWPLYLCLDKRLPTSHNNWVTDIKGKFYRRNLCKSYTSRMFDISPRGLPIDGRGSLDSVLGCDVIFRIAGRQQWVAAGHPNWWSPRSGDRHVILTNANHSNWRVGVYYRLRVLIIRGSALQVDK